MASTKDQGKGRRSVDFRQRREQFDRAWQGTKTPAIEQFVPSPETAASFGYTRRQLLAELVEIDIECRWKAGFPRSHFDSADDVLPSKPRIEDYLVRFPELGTADDLPVELVIQEYKARHKTGEPVEHEEYLARFPALAERLSVELRNAQTNMTEPTARFVRCPQCHSSIAVPALAALAREVVTCECGEKIPIIDERTGDHREGELVGSYRLLRWLGRGSFANVWQAFDEHLERNVALKIPYVRRQGEAQPNLTSNEAKAVAGLEHANIVRVYELGKGDDAFIASEYIAGQNLEAALRIRPRSPVETAELCRKMADALHYMHSKGVVHRDVKPSNILLDERDEPHLTDFGLAKREKEHIALSSAGELIGTVAYMSPEQAAGKGHAADGRADIFSLGIVMYEMLAGTLPFHGDRLTIMNKIERDDPPSILKHAPRVPRDLETICFRCLEKAPAKRFATAAELSYELGRFLRGEPILTRPASPLERLVKYAKRHPARAIAAATSTAAAVAIVVALGLVVHRAWEQEKQIADLAKTAVKRHVEFEENLSRADLGVARVKLDDLKAILRELRDQDPDRLWLADEANGNDDKVLADLESKLRTAQRARDNEKKLEELTAAVTTAITKADQNYRATMALIGSALFAGQLTQDEAPGAATWRPTIGDSEIASTEQMAKAIAQSDLPNRKDDPPSPAPLADESVQTPTEVLPSQLPAQGLGGLRFPANEREALREMQSEASAALAALGIDLTKANNLSADSDGLIWNRMQQANAAAAPNTDPPFGPEQVKPLQEMACELILLHANATFQLNNNDAGRALEQLTVAARVGLVRESISPPAARAAGQSSENQPQIPAYTYRRLKQEFAGTPVPVSLATFEPSPQDNPTWFDYFFAGCRAMPANALDDREELYDVPLRHFENSYEADPDRIWTSYFMAICQIREGNSDAADIVLTRHIKHNPEFPFAYILRGIARGEVYRTDPPGRRAAFHDAIADFDLAKARIKNQIETDMASRLQFAVAMSRATLQFDAARVDAGQRESRLAEAATGFRQAALLARGRDQHRQNRAESHLALVLSEQGKKAEASATLDGVLNRVAADDARMRASLLMPRAELRLNLGDKVGAAADFREAANLFKAIGSPATHVQWASAQVNYAWTAGIAQTNRDQRPAAIQACEQVIQLAGKPEYHQSEALKNCVTAAHLIHAKLRSAQAGDCQRDVKRFAEAGKQFEEQQTTARVARDRQRLAALESLDAYVSDRTDDAAALEMRGNLRMKPGMPNQYLAGAVEDYGRAAFLYQQAGLKQAELRTRRMQALCQATWGAPEAAVEAFDRAIDGLGNDTIDMRLGRGFALAAAAEDFDRAFADAEHVAKHSGDPFDLYRAAGIYALAAAYAHPEKNERLDEEFGRRGDRSLELLYRALQGSVDNEGNFLHPKAATIVSFPQSKTFQLLWNRKLYLHLQSKFVLPVQRKAQANRSRAVPIRNAGGGK